MDDLTLLPEEPECNDAQFFPFWPLLTPEQQRHLAQHSKMRRVQAGENIYFHQICNDGIYFVCEGVIRVYVMSPTGREATLYQRRRGEIGVILPMQETRAENTIPVFQAEEAALISYIPRQELYAAADDSPAVHRLYETVTASCVQEVVNSFYSAAFLPLRARVARILLEKAAHAPERTVIEVTHEQLAGATGTSREVATRTLDRMQAAGVLRTGRRCVELLDLEKLRAIAAL